MIFSLAETRFRLKSKIVGSVKLIRPNIITLKAGTKFIAAAVKSGGNKYTVEHGAITGCLLPEREKPRKDEN
jgi:hypothetical protein